MKILRQRFNGRVICKCDSVNRVLLISLAPFFLVGIFEEIYLKRNKFSNFENIIAEVIEIAVICEAEDVRHM